MKATDFFEQNLNPPAAVRATFVVAGVAVQIMAQSELLEAIRYSVGHLESTTTPEILLTVIRRSEMLGELPAFERRRSVATAVLEYEYLGELDSIGFRNLDQRALLVLGHQAPSLARPEAMRILLDWLLVGRGLVALHGATISWGSQTALISNRGGSGKSSTTAACVVAGAVSCGDDFLLGDQKFKLHSVSRTVKLAADSPARALYANASPGERASFQSDQSGEKDLFLLDQLVPHSMAASAQPAVLWIPRVSGRWQLSPIDPFEVLQAVAPNSVAMNRDRIGALNYVKQLISQLPAFALEVGPDLAAGVKFLRRELEK